MEKSNLLNQFYQLRNELDQHCADLYELHAPHLKCKAGCDMCCMDFSVLPVEFDAIRAQAGDALQNGLKNVEPGQCPFLVNHRCVIYAARPVICRTQGLPLLFMGEEQWELSACELNFTDFDWDEFSEENTFPLDRYNSRLYMLNQQYVQSLPGNSYTSGQLISLSSLLKNND